MELNEVIKYLAEHLSVEVETEPAIYDESARVQVILKLDDIVISEASGPIHTG